MSVNPPNFGSDVDDVLEIGKQLAHARTTSGQLRDQLDEAQTRLKQAADEIPELLQAVKDALGKARGITEDLDASVSEAVDGLDDNTWVAVRQEELRLLVEVVGQFELYYQGLVTEAQRWGHTMPPLMGFYWICIKDLLARMQQE